MGFGKRRPIKKSSLKSRLKRDLLENTINPIQELDECDEESEEYIELPAVTITLEKATPRRSRRVKVGGSPVSEGGGGDAGDNGITYENGHTSSRCRTPVLCVPDKT